MSGEGDGGRPSALRGRVSWAEACPRTSRPPHSVAFLDDPSGGRGSGPAAYGSVSRAPPPPPPRDGHERVSGTVHHARRGSRYSHYRYQPLALKPVEEVDGRSSPGGDGGPSAAAGADGSGGVVNSGAAGASGTAPDGGGGGAGGQLPASSSADGRPEMVDSTFGRQTAVRPPPEAASPGASSTASSAHPSAKAGKGAGKRPPPPSSLPQTPKEGGGKKWEDTGEEGKKGDGGGKNKSPGLSDNRKSGDLEEIELEEEVLEWAGEGGIAGVGGREKEGGGGAGRGGDAEEAGRGGDLEEGGNGEAGDGGGEGEGRRRIGDRSKSIGEQHWTNVRAVMALYSRLRKIKRTKSNQRWMKLRTTVQLSGAISSTIQKKTPLKREDSFLKRFSTRQIPETQETMDTGDDGDDGGSSSAGGGGGGAGGNGEGGGGGCGGGGGLSSHATSDERRRRRRRVAHHRRRQVSPRSVINPDENFYFYWLFVLTACVLYNLWTLIVRQSFPELQAGLPIFWRCGDAFGDAVFLLDVAVQFRTGYLEQGLMVYDSKKLAAHYITSKAFLLDLFALAPLDLVQLSPRVGPNPILRFPRFLKVYRLIDYYYMVESRTVYPNLWRVVNLVHILLILAHWFGCFYYLLSEAEGFQGDWVYPHRLEGDYATLTRKYLGSLYWSTLTLTTIGDLPTPETNAEYVFTIVSYLIGVFIFATIVGQVGNVITNRNANRLEFERLLDGAKTYMRHHKVPGDMKRRVLRWYDYSWSRGRIQGGGDINTALGLLPDKLKTELALHVNLSVLKKVTIFQECQPEFLHDLVLKMKAYIFTPGDLICRKGEVAREMFIIADGILEVMSETGRVLTTMKAGDFFGEIGILNLDGLNKRTADVRSVGYSELFSLSREDVLAAMKDYPEAQEILQSLGRKRLMEARNSGGRGSKKAISRSSTKVASSPSPASIKSSPPALGKCSSKDEKESSRALQRQASSSSSSPALLGTSMDHSVDAESGITGKRIVEKLKSDVMGLREVLRKSKRIASRGMCDEAIELQPLTKETPTTSSMTTGSIQDKSPQLKALLLRTLTSRHNGNWESSGSGIKGALRRMSHVKSDDSGGEAACSKSSPPERHQVKRKRSRTKGDQGSEDADGEGEPDKSNEDQQQKVEVIGEGLPLLTRLRMLREKEERERKMRERRKNSKEESKLDVVEKPPTKVRDEEQESNAKPVEVIGEGLPLFTRLRMLREKEEREAAAAAAAKAAEEKDLQSENGVDERASTAAVGSSTHASPPSTSEPQDKTVSAKTEEKPVAGRGRHLIQRLLLLKAREEREKQEKLENTPAPSHAPDKAVDSVSSTICSTASTSITLPRVENVDSTPVMALTSTTTTASQISVAVVPPRTRDLNQSECDGNRDVPCVDRRYSGPDRGFTSECSGEVRDTCRRTTVAQVIGMTAPTSVEESVSINQDVEVQSTCASDAMPCVIVQVEAEEVDEGEMIGQVSEEPDNELCSAAFERKQEHRARKPNLLHLKGDKNYVSIDDLSPEYSGLPFVKKLKILNDRQRLAELEKSSSLDSGDCSERTELCNHTLSRSFSDASYISNIGPQITFHGFGIRDSPHTRSVVKDKASDCDDNEKNEEEDLRGLSPESNETLERRNLKSILKKLSGSLAGDEDAAKAGLPKSEGRANTVGATKRDLCQLMRAPTVEGYAARHSKLTKSVTFNRDTLASPPRTPTTTSVTPSIPLLYTPELPILSLHEKQQTGQELSTIQQPSISNLNSTSLPSTLDRRLFSHQGSKDSHEHREEEYFEEVILGIKQVIQSHLEEIQNKFQERFLSLESEVKRRDEIIYFLQRRIKELEEPAVGTSANGNTISADDNSTSSSDEINPFMRGDSADTVVTADLEDDTILDKSTNTVLLDHDVGVPRQRSKRHDKRKLSHASSGEALLPAQDARSADSLSIWLGNRDGNLKMSSSTSSSSSSFTTSSSPSVSSSSSQEENDDDQMAGRNKDWEVQMLARELERRQGVKRLREEDERSEKLEKGECREEELDSHHRLARRFLRLSRSERELLERLLGSDEEPDEEEGEDRVEEELVWHQTKSLKQPKKKTRKNESRRKGTTVSRRKNGSKTKNSGDGKALAHDSFKESDVVDENKKRKVWIGQQVLNARSLEETGPSGKLPSPSSASRRRAASTGQLPFLLPLPSLASLSNSFRGIAKAATTGVGQMSSQVSEPDPEKAVVTISGSGHGSSDRPIDTAIISESSSVPKL